MHTIEAQIPNPESMDSLYRIPDLDALVRTAWANSPLLKEQEAFIEQRRQEKILKKKNWMNKISTDGSYALSNNLAVTSSDASNSDPVNAITTKQGANYRFGIIARVSLFDFMGRKNQRKLDDARIDAALFREESLRQEIKQEVLNYYIDLKLSRQKIRLASDKRQALFAQKQIAEKQFLESQIGVEDLGRITELFSNAEVNFATEVALYQKLYHSLEIIIGLPLNEL